MGPESINITNNVASVNHNAYKNVSVAPVVENVSVPKNSGRNSTDVANSIEFTGVKVSASDATYALKDGNVADKTTATNTVTDSTVADKTAAANVRNAEDDKYESVMTEKAVENANQRLKNSKTTAKFKYDDEIGRVTITIQDVDTKEIVKEIPTEEMRSVIEHLHTMRGLLIDEGV